MIGDGEEDHHEQDGARDERPGSAGSLYANHDFGMLNWATFTPLCINRYGLRILQQCCFAVVRVSQAIDTQNGWSPSQFQKK